MNVRRLSWAICLGAIFVCGAEAQPDKVSDLQAKFDHEKDPVHRVKSFEKLGDAQFEESRRAFKANDFVAVGVVFEKYRDNARVAFDGLTKKHADAERQSNGYRQLEIHIRRGLREVEETLLRVPEEFQPPMQLVRGDLDRMDRELIKMLFHYRDNAQKPPKNSQGAEAHPNGEKP